VNLTTRRSSGRDGDDIGRGRTRSGTAVFDRRARTSAARAWTTGDRGRPDVAAMDRVVARRGARTTSTHTVETDGRRLLLLGGRRRTQKPGAEQSTMTNHRIDHIGLA